MKRILIVMVLMFDAYIAEAQISGQFNTKMHVVSYELNKLILNDSLRFTNIDSLVFAKKISICTEPKDLYYRMRFIKENDSILVIIEQSAYPGRKQKESIGYFEYNDYIVIVSGRAGEQFFQQLPVKKTFSYSDYIQPTLMTLEDDIPLWIFRYQDGEFNFTPFPE